MEPPKRVHHTASNDPCKLVLGHRKLRTTHVQSPHMWWPKNCSCLQTRVPLPVACFAPLLRPSCSDVICLESVSRLCSVTNVIQVNAVSTLSTFVAFHHICFIVIIIIPIHFLLTIVSITTYWPYYSEHIFNTVHYLPSITSSFSYIVISITSVHLALTIVFITTNCSHYSELIFETVHHLPSNTSPIIYHPCYHHHIYSLSAHHCTPHNLLLPSCTRNNTVPIPVSVLTVQQQEHITRATYEWSHLEDKPFLGSAHPLQ
jgi:hypothetical protein